MNDILGLSAVDQLAALRAGTISAVELFDLELARYRAQNPRLNAVIHVDLDRARAAAAASDRARAASETLGPLAGLPMTVKDTYDVEGMEASGGVEAFRHREATDAVLVARTKAAGAVIWGKTNIPVMAGDWQSYNRVFGTTNNPWDLERTPGGSSGGSAASLAAQISALEIGSDIAGSLRVPAAFCGVVAHKPTLHFLPKLGHVPPAPGRLAPGDLTVAGPMARTVRDVGLLLHVLSAGVTPADIVPADLKALKVGLWLDDPKMVLDAPVRAAIEAWAQRLTAAGATITSIASPVEAQTLLSTYNFLLMSHLGGGFRKAAWDHWQGRRAEAAADIRNGAGPLSFASSILAATASHRDWMAANEARFQLKAQVAAVFKQYDVIVSPVAPVEPFRHDHSDFHGRRLTCSNGETIDYALMKTWVALATTCGLPATSIPAGLSSRGLPIGVQVIGPDGEDAKTLAAALALEQAAGGYVAPPGL